MASIPLPFHSYTLRSAPASPSRLLNCYAEALPATAKTPMILSRAPGVREFADVGGGAVRGLHAAFGRLYAVVGTTLYSFSAAAVAVNLGSIPGTSPVSMAHNLDSLVVVAEPNAYHTDGVTPGSVAQITDPDFTSRGAKYVRFVDNYLLFMEPNSGRFFGSDLGSATDYDALNFATAEGAPDDLTGMEVDHRQVILLGAESGEIWENTGASGFPFERSINGFFEIGCFNGDTVAKLDNSIYWLANDYTVRRLEGTTPRRVSTHAVEQFLSTVDVGSGRAYSYTQDGHFFYVLSFESGCWVYDATTNEWHERASYPSAYFRWQTQAGVHGRQYVASAYSSQIGYFDPLVYDEAGETQRMSWTYQPVYAENRLAAHRRLEVVLEVGVGLVTGQGDDPEIMLECSDDGGKTWRSFPNKKIGKIGEYTARVFWNNLGSARQRVYRMSVSDPVKIVVSDTTLEVEGGRV